VNKQFGLPSLAGQPLQNRHGCKICLNPGDPLSR
jgi:hypothetical protein